MKFIRYPQYKSETKGSVITIGNFDGVHIGHQALMKQVAVQAKKYNLTSIVITMQPLASQYFAGKNNVAILTPFKCKYQLIKNIGIDAMCVLNFNDKLAQMSPTSFIDDVLINGLKAEHIIIGDDFRFGKKRVGDFQFLKNHCHTKGITVTDSHTITHNDVRVSSSQIRKALANSQFNRVEECLGRKYSIAGRISHGQKLGRKLEFPTINIKLHNKVVPIDGIFAVMVKFQAGSKYIGAASLGMRPTVNGNTKILEVHLLDFNKQVYGQNVEVFFYHKIRNEVKFDSLDELKRHIKEDVIKTRLYFSNNKDNGVIA